MAGSGTRGGGGVWGSRPAPPRSPPRPAEATPAARTRPPLPPPSPPRRSAPLASGRRRLPLYITSPRAGVTLPPLHRASLPLWRAPRLGKRVRWGRRRGGACLGRRRRWRRLLSVSPRGALGTGGGLIRATGAAPAPPPPLRKQLAPLWGWCVRGWVGVSPGAPPAAALRASVSPGETRPWHRVTSTNQITNLIN